MRLVKIDDQYVDADKIVSIRTEFDSGPETGYGCHLIEGSEHPVLVMSNKTRIHIYGLSMRKVAKLVDNNSKR